MAFPRDGRSTEQVRAGIVLAMLRLRVEALVRDP
jgi:hypothetical protein